MRMLLIFVVLLVSFTAMAEHRLIMPINTAHVGSSDYEFNNDNPGIGYEYKDDSMVYNVTYLDKNSYGENSLYLSASKETKLSYNTVASFGLVTANGYEAVSDSGLLVSAISSLRYKSVRVVTSWPTSAIACPAGDKCADFVNVQWVQKF